jgi:mannose-6-phosphate isomerase-like protein (cupin superfamily)
MNVSSNRFAAAREIPTIHSSESVLRIDLAFRMLAGSDAGLLKSDWRASPFIREEAAPTVTAECLHSPLDGMMAKFSEFRSEATWDHHLWEHTMQVNRRWRFAALALALVLGWSGRELALALGQARQVASATINLDQIQSTTATDKGEPVGRNSVYISGDTPASTKFVTGRFVLQPGKSPHAPHTHAEEEVMIIESGQGTIFCDGKTTKIGPGSVMYTTPNAPHGITNTGSEPIVFYYIKWAGR